MIFVARLSSRCFPFLRCYERDVDGRGCGETLLGRQTDRRRFLARSDRKQQSMITFPEATAKESMMAESLALLDHSSATEPGHGLPRDNIEYLGGWTEVQSKKTQQKMKALSRQSSANKLIGPGATLSKKSRQQSGKNNSGQGNTTSSISNGSSEKISHSQTLKSLKKSYSQALSHEGKGSSDASLSRPELNAQASKETIVVSEVCSSRRATEINVLTSK